MQKEQIYAENRLTDTLRHLVLLLQYLEAPILAIRFKYGGEEWEADTPEEAVALRIKLESTLRYPEDTGESTLLVQKEFWTPDKFLSVIDGIGIQQHRMLATLFHSPGGMPTEAIRAVLGLDSEVALAGVISGLSKQLKPLGIELGEVFQIHVKWAGKKKTRSFALTDPFKFEGIAVGWPEGWASKLKIE